MKEYSREWFIAQAAASSKVVESWPQPIKRNLVLASAFLPTTSPTKAYPGQQNTVVVDALAQPAPSTILNERQSPLQQYQQQPAPSVAPEDPKRLPDAAQEAK